jgi:hypothetical protein
MVKVSFIALFLAAIGYKEYNPSVVGKWELRTRYRVETLDFKNDGSCVMSSVPIKSCAFDLDTLGQGLYSLYGDTLTLKNVKLERDEKYVLLRQNKRKLVLRRYPIGCLFGRSKFKFKRLK